MKIHFIGIGGIGTSALAQYYLAKGFSVSGSDVSASDITDSLKLKGAEIFIGHREENLPANSGLVIYNAAIGEENPELKKARELGMQAKLYSQVLGELVKQMKTIAVSGTHGKSTTTAMIGLILEKAGFDPTVIVGSKVREWRSGNFRPGKGDWLVIEADEYGRSFLNYWPGMIVLTNIEEDHLDTYKNLEDIIKTFGEYVSRLGENGILVYNLEDSNTLRMIQNPCFNQPGMVHGYCSNFQIDDLKLKIPGRHNLLNAYAAISAARIVGIPDKVSVAALNEFSGIWRRMEYKGELNGAKIYDDYGHHPTEIKATLEGLREQLFSIGDSRQATGHLWCVFQPHQYDRTYKLFDQFISAFDAADETLILPIYSVPGRESEEIKQKVSSEKLVQAINEAYRSEDEEAIYMDSFEKTAECLKTNLKPGDIAVIMGAGDVWKITKDILA